MTQAELGEKMGVTQAAISTWETGRVVPGAQQKRRLKEILGITTARRTSGAAGPAIVESGPPAFGVWLNRQRLQAGMSVTELAAAAGVSGPAIYNIEAGRSPNPRQSSIAKLEKALGAQLPQEAREEMQQEATILGMGELVDFDPHDEANLPTDAGIYVLYDISERPIYVGQSSNIKARIRSHNEKFWFKQPIVQTGAYVGITDRDMREKVELLLIRFLKSNAVINKQNVDR
jgi:transcriptional regulator with XRE-family HTH domain